MARLTLKERLVRIQNELDTAAETAVKTRRSGHDAQDIAQRIIDALELVTLAIRSENAYQARILKNIEELSATIKRD